MDLLLKIHFKYTFWTKFFTYSTFYISRLNQIKFEFIHDMILDHYLIVQ